VALQGALGKPRPALVIQSDLFDAHPSVTILPVTGELRDAPLFRISVNPSEPNGLSKPSQVMVDKPQSIPREKIGAVMGRLDDETMLAVNRALAVFLGFA
jgi:mRNA interferase MazF